MSSSPGKDQIENGIKEIYNTVLSTKNITARYIAILALASLWLDAYDFAAMSFATASLENTFPNVSSLLISFSIGVIDLGALFGAIVGGWLNDRIGRRDMFILNMILFIFMAVLGGFSTNIYELTVFRGLLGFALGADTATGFTYIFEYLEREQRLFWSNLWQLQWYIMYLVTIGFILLPFYFIEHSLTTPILWRVIMIVGGVIAAVILGFRSKIPESVLWLAYQGKLATAKKIIKKTYGIDLPNVPDVDVVIRHVGKGIKSAFVFSKLINGESWYIVSMEILNKDSYSIHLDFIFHTFCWH